MVPALARYIDTARRFGLSDKAIQDNLVEAGWDAADAKAALSNSAGLMPPPPPPPGKHKGAPATDAAPALAPGADKLVRVVTYRSTAGLEYIIFFISLWVAAMSLAALLHGLVDIWSGKPDSFYQEINTFAAAALLVSFPVFSWLLLRLKKKELGEPEIRRDVNRKNAVQLTLIVTFLIGLGKTVAYVYQLMNSGSGFSDFGPFWAEAAHTVITVGIAGAIFAYYWADEHRKGESQS